MQAADDALFRVARAAGGSMRDGLSLLDQLMSASGAVTDEGVIRILGTPPDERMNEIVGAIADGDAAVALGALDGVLSSGVTLNSVVTALGGVYRNMMLAVTCGGDSDLIELPETERQAVCELAKRFSTPVLVHGLGLIQGAGRNIRGSSVARGLVEATLVRLAQAEKFINPENIVERLEQLSSSGPDAGQKKKHS